MPDRFEDNDTRQQASANGSSLPVPALGQQSVLDDLSLCTAPDSSTDTDWYEIELTAGDQVSIRGFSPAMARAGMRIVAPDLITELDTGLISETGGNAVEFTAAIAGTYYLAVSQLNPNLEGVYRLTTIRTPTVQPCSDSFEDDNGTNNLPGDATLLYDFDTPAAPLQCQLLTQGTTSIVRCDGTPKICPGDVDYYAFRAPNGADVQVRLTEFAPDVDLDLYGPFDSLADVATSPLLARSDFALTKTVSATARPDRAYLIRVYPDSNPVTPYDLELRVTPTTVPCQEDVLDSATTAAPYTMPMTEVVDVNGFNDSQATATDLALIPGPPPGGEH